MLTYYIDFRITASGQYEIHHGGCRDLPERNNLVYLGRHDSSVDALTYGRTIFTNLRACRHCCPECHLHHLGSEYAPVDPCRLPPTDDLVH